MDSKQEVIDHYLEKLLEINESINLTRITDDNDARLLHIEDSLSGLKEMNEAPAGLYADLGSGGGFPGVPLAIMSGRSTLLVDSVQKKMRAVQDIIDELGLHDQIRTYSGRIEELSEKHKGEFSVLTARALSSLPSLLELASPLLKEGGELICFKTPREDELDEALNIQKKLGFELIKKREFTLSDNETKRCILVFKKTGESEMKLPRRVGLAQKRPLTA